MDKFEKIDNAVIIETLINKTKEVKVVWKFMNGNTINFITIANNKSYTTFIMRVPMQPAKPILVNPNKFNYVFQIQFTPTREIIFEINTVLGHPQSLINKIEDLFNLGLPIAEANTLNTLNEMFEKL